MLGVKWLEGTHGRKTLRLMGVADSDNEPTTLQEERKRISDFLTREDQLNWMIEFDNHVVGAIWVDLEPAEYLPAPAVNIMIGDPEFRGMGIGSASTRAVVDYLEQSGAIKIYSRHMVENTGSSRLLRDIGFVNFGEQYQDTDGLDWQNVSLTGK